MKKFINKQKNVIISLIGLILVCEFLLNINNKFIQSIGIILTPVIALMVYLLIRNDQKKLTNK